MPYESQNYQSIYGAPYYHRACAVYIINALYSLLYNIIQWPLHTCKGLPFYTAMLMTLNSIHCMHADNNNIIIIVMEDDQTG